VNMLLWWLVIMVGSWALAAWVLWGTNLVASKEEERDDE